jgi:methyl acetate hydrolase
VLTTTRPVIHLASMTKFVTCISCYQLVDRGVLTLDDPAIVTKYLPELKDLEILDGYDGDKPILRKAKKQITLRMLMSHTAGENIFFSFPC